MLVNRHLHQRGQRGSAIGLYIGNQDRLQVTDLRTALGESQCRPTTDVYHHDGPTVLTEQESAAGTVVANVRAAGTENLHSDSGIGTGLCADRRHNCRQQYKNRREAE